MMKKKKIKISEILTNLLLAISILIFGCSIFTFVTNSDTPEDAFLFGYKPIYIKTGSMEPTLKVNGIAIVKKINYENVKLDDIIMYTIDDKMITHRVIDITEEGIRTQGDNNPVQDTYFLQPENVKGKVVLIMNGTSTVVSEIGTPKGIFKWVVFPIVSIVVLVVSVNLIKKIVKDEKNNKTKERKDNNNTKKETNDILTINLENLKSQDYDTNYKKTIKILNEYFTW